MDEMKKKVDRLSGVYERSDVMLANYPGGVSRFARHIDNTTGDGRRLTMLIYLNLVGNESKVELCASLPLQARGMPKKTRILMLWMFFPSVARVAMFYSADIPHEVMPTYGDRHVFTIWYYDSQERTKAVQESKRRKERPKE